MHCMATQVMGHTTQHHPGPASFPDFPATRSAKLSSPALRPGEPGLTATITSFRNVPPAGRYPDAVRQRRADSDRRRECREVWRAMLIGSVGVAW